MFPTLLLAAGMWVAAEGRPHLLAQAPPSPAPPAVVQPEVPRARGRRGGGFRQRYTNLEGAEEGKAIYNRSCTMCHGIDGTAGDRAPALGAQRRYARRTEEAVFDAIKNGIRGTLMPSSALPDGDIRKMIAYIFSLRATAADVNVAGNLQKGEEIFRTKGRCVECHMVRGRGGLLGPDLTNIAAERKLEELRSSLTQAKEMLPPGYQGVDVTTKRGQTIHGVVKNEDNFSLQILGSDEKLHLLLRDEVSEIRYLPESLMPSNLDRKLTKEEFQDLLAFLAKQVRSEAR